MKNNFTQNKNFKSLIILLFFIDFISSIIIANSKLETCLKNSSITNNMNKSLNSDTGNALNESDQEKMNCIQKIIVSLSIDNSKSADTDYLEAFITEVEDNKINLSSNLDKLNYLFDQNPKKLENPIRINISKSPVYIEYPSIYFQTFNFNPTEQVIISSVFGCEDGDLAQNPTCGWTINSLNQRIPFSQGFCCKCDFSQIIGINTTDRNRGNTCSFLNLSSGSASAHCLKYDELWWSAYEINSYQIVYEIEINISYISPQDDTSKNVKRKLMNYKDTEKIQFEDILTKPNNFISDKNYNFEINNTQFRHLNDFKTENTSFNFDNKSQSLLTHQLNNTIAILGRSDESYNKNFINNSVLTEISQVNKQKLINNNNIITKKITLGSNNRVGNSDDSKVIARLIGDFLPSFSITDFSNYFLLIPSYPINHPMVTQGALNWMIIPREYFTIDGRECNKIGVSYSAFRNQENKCQMKIGDCLHNQIIDLYNEDLTRISNGKNAKYIISQAKLMNEANVDFYSLSSDRKKLAFKVNGIFNSLISLEISADNIKYIVNISNGEIDYIKIEIFENNSNNGLITLQITNTGKLASEFNIAYSCSDDILPLISDIIDLGAYESQEIKKNIYTTNSNFLKNQSLFYHNCTVKLNDFNGNLLDVKKITFNTTKIEEFNSQVPKNATSTNKNNENSLLQNNDSIGLDCSILCPDFFNFLCFIFHGCWGYFIRTILISLFILGLIFIIVRSIKNGTFCKYFSKIFFCFNFFKFKNKNQVSVPQRENIYSDDNYNSDLGKMEHARDYSNFGKILRMKMFLNFSNVNFNFNQFGIYNSFSVEIIVFYCFHTIGNRQKIQIKNIKFDKKFKTFCKHNGINDILNIDFLKNKIDYMPNFMTKYPTYHLI